MARFQLDALLKRCGQTIAAIVFSSSYLSANVLASSEYDYLFSLPLEDLVRLKINGSTLTDENILTVPAAVTVFTQNDIKKLGINRLTQLANFVPGFQAYRTDESGLQESVSNRGRRLGTAGREILVLLDGIRLNNDNVGGAFAHYPFISLSDVERVEFIRGPGSAIHGANAALAVINIISRKTGRSLQTSAGEHGSYQATAQTDLRFHDGTVSLLAETLESQGEHPTIYDSIDRRLENTNDSYGVQTLHSRWQWNDWSGGAHYHRSRSPDFYVLGGANLEENETYVEDYSLDFKRTVFFSDGFKQDAMVFYKRHMTDAKGVAIPAGSPLLLPNTTQFIIGGETYQEEIGASWTLANNKPRFWHWLAGLEYRRPEILESGIYGNYDTLDLASLRTLTYYGDLRFSSKSLPEEARFIRSAFAQAQLYLLDKWDFVIGGRVDDFSDFGSHFSPRAAGIYHVDSTNALKLTYGEAFRPPGILELYTQNSVVFLGNPDLEPEVAKTTELTWEHIKGNSQWSTTVYNVLIEDAFVRVIPPGNFKRMWVNGDRLSTAGVEFEWRYAVSNAWGLRTTGSTVFDEVLHVNSEAKHLGSLSIHYDATPWVISLSGVYHGPRRDANNSAVGYTDIGGHTLWNGRLTYVINPALDVFLRGENLLNKEYVAPAEQALANIVGVPGRGRNIEIGAIWNYE